MPIARFRMPDGRIGRFEVPEGTTPDQAQSMMEAHFKQNPSQDAPSAREKFLASLPPERRALAEKPVDFGKEGEQRAVEQERAANPLTNLYANVSGGAIKGASNIGSTLLRPFESKASNQERRSSINDFMVEHSDPESMSFKGGELGAEIMGTAGVGGALAKGVRAAPAVSPYLTKLATALETGGFKLGTPASKTLVGKAVDIGTRMGAGATVGGVSAGLVDPEYAKSGAIIGGVLPGAARFAGQTGKAIKAAVYDPIVNKDKLIGAALVRALGSKTDDVLHGAGTAAKTDGVRYSAGQSSGNEAINAIEDAIKSANPGGSLSRLDQSNRTILADKLRQLGQDDVAIKAAEKARGMATTPLYTKARQSEALADPSRVVSLIDRIEAKNPANNSLLGPLREIRETLFESYDPMKRASDAWKSLDESLYKSMSGPDYDTLMEARKLMHRVRNGSISPQDALDGMKGLSGNGKHVQEALDLAREYMKTPDYVLRQKPGDLISAMDNIKALLAKQENSFARAELTTIKNALAHQISKVEPSFSQAERTFAEMSRPINQMEVGQYLSNKLIPSTAGDVPSRLNAASLASALRNQDQVAKVATGFKRAKLDKVMTPEQLDTIMGVNADASRMAEMRTLGAGYGSPTARRIAAGNFIGDNLKEQAPILTALANALNATPGVNLITKGGTQVGNMLGSKINTQMLGMLEDALANNPELVAQYMRKSIQGQTPLLSQKANDVLRTTAVLAPSRN